MLKGIDISAHNWTTPIDFSQVKASGIDFAIIRDGYGTSTVDKKFIDNVNGCLNAGIKVKGIYHFSYALAPRDAIEEARFAMTQMQVAGLGSDVIIFFDFEYDTLRYAKDLGRILGPADANAHAKAFCDEIEANGYQVGIYFNLDFLNNWYDHNLLKDYKKWLAEYDAFASIPCNFQQYTDQGIVPGMTGPVDLNYDHNVIVEEPNMDFEKLTDAEVDAWLARINKRLAQKPTTEYAIESSKKAVQAGIFSDGDKDLLIDAPGGFLLRQDAAVILNRIGFTDWALAMKK